MTTSAATTNTTKLQIDETLLHAVVDGTIEGL
jgi:hypothetical protein